MAAFDRVPADEWEQLARALDAAIDGLSAGQQARAVGRACRRAGVAELDASDERHVRILWDELRAAALRASLDRLVRKGELEATGVSETGHLTYAASGRGGRP